LLFYFLNLSESIVSRHLQKQEVHGHRHITNLIFNLLICSRATVETIISSAIYYSISASQILPTIL